MNRTEQVIQIVAKNTKVAPGKITPETSTENHSDWDSLAHINIMMELEETFDIMIDVEDFPSLGSVSAIVAYLEKAAS